MSLQDIKQVLSRIISLNKNLNENRLNTLLEAGGWEKQNKEEALSIFKILGAKSNEGVRVQQSNDVKQIAQEVHREISTEVLDQELSVVENKQPSIEIKEKTIMNFIPANLPIKEEDRQEIFVTNNRSIDLSTAPAQTEVSPVISIIPEKIPGAKESVDASSQQAKDVKQTGEKPINKKEKVNLVPILAILLIIFLVVFGYLYGHGVLK